MCLINKIIIIFFIILFPVLSYADTYYVDKNHGSASDDNPGTEALPWLTIQKAANTLTAGDTVYVKEGTYTEEGAEYPNSSIDGIKPQNSGTSGYVITYAAYPGHTVVIDQQNLYDTGFYIEGKDYLVFDGFEIKNVDRTTGGTGGIFACADTDYLVVKNCHVHHVDCGAGGNVGALKLDDCSNCTAQNNLLHDITVNEDMTNQNGACVHSYDMDYTTIENNTMYNAANGVFHKRSSGYQGCIIRYNLIYDTELYGIRYSIGGSGDPGHVDQVAYQNIMYNVPIGIITTTGGDDPDSSGLDIYNNVIWATNLAIRISAYFDVEIYNNIIYNATNYGIMTEYDPSTWSITYCDYNDYYTDTKFWLNAYDDDSVIYNNLSEWKAGTAYDDYGITQDPKFVNPSGGDFHLQGDSPCLGTGKTGVNMGAYITGNEIIGYQSSSTDVVLQGGGSIVGTYNASGVILQ